MSYIDLGYRPGKNDLVCEFLIEPAKGVSLKKAAENVALESSTGTWTPVTTRKPFMDRISARVFEIRGKRVRIAYPLELFEKGNIPQLLSSVAGNVFGMKLIGSLRLEDIEIPKSYARSFGGPEFGMDDLRRHMGIKSRPIVGTIFKPKLGLRPSEMAELAYKVYSAGIDYTKDDENLSSMVFNRFEERVVGMLEVVDRIKSEQGRNVIYACNITSPADEMVRRAEFVKENGGKCIMIDIITTGWSGLQHVRNQKFGLAIHAHRAMHAAFTRNRKHGISMKVVAKLSRLVGVTALHTGTVVGKMEGDRKEITEIDSFLRSKWYSFKKTFPIASGGLHPKLVPKLLSILGRDIIMTFGGGLWGHPEGPEAGAKAIRQAVDSVIEGVPIRRYAKDRPELARALEYW